MERQLISFDWALKKLLRNKANFDILEGFLSALLLTDVRIESLIDSESNTEEQINKINRVDILAELKGGEMVIIELQYSSEYDYFHRILFASSRLISEHLEVGEKYREVKKVYYVSLIYFDLGQGTDYVYHGKTDFVGIHEKDTLQLSEFQQKNFKKDKVSEIYPEYYIIKINNFNNIAKDNLDQWIYYFKNGNVKDNFAAKGIDKVRKNLLLQSLNPSERKAYIRHIDNLVIEKDAMNTSRQEGLAEGKLEGLAEGEKKGIEKGKLEGLAEGEKKAKVEIAKQMKSFGVDIKLIIKSTGLSEKEINEL